LKSRKGISVAAAVTVAIAIVAALGVGILAVTVFPSGLSTTYSGTTTSTAVSPNPGTATTYTATSTAAVSGPVEPPALFTGVLSTQDVSCSLATGVCTLTIVNNSTVPLKLETCEMVATTVIENSSSTTITQSNTVNGTIGGPATAGISANSEVGATCTVPAEPFAHQAAGSPVNGSFVVNLVDSYYYDPAGTAVHFGFEGTWS
jgi:hypothetical protein